MVSIKIELSITAKIVSWKNCLSDGMRLELEQYEANMVLVVIY